MAFSLFKSLCRGTRCSRKRIVRKRNYSSGIAHYSQEDPEYKEISEEIFNKAEMLSINLCRRKLGEKYIKEILSGEHNKPAVITIMKSEDDIKGFALFSIENNGILQNNEILHLHIICAKKGSGIGKQIMNSIEEYAKDSNIKTIKLESVFSSVRFYKKLGYTVDKNSVNFTSAFNDSNSINSNYNGDFGTSVMTKRLRDGTRKKKLNS